MTLGFRGTVDTLDNNQASCLWFACWKNPLAHWEETLAFNLLAPFLLA